MTIINGIPTDDPRAIIRCAELGSNGIFIEYPNLYTLQTIGHFVFPNSEWYERTFIRAIDVKNERFLLLFKTSTLVNNDPVQVFLYKLDQNLSKLEEWTPLLNITKIDPTEFPIGTHISSLIDNTGKFVETKSILLYYGGNTLKYEGGRSTVVPSPGRYIFHKNPSSFEQTEKGVHHQYFYYQDIYASLWGESFGTFDQYTSIITYDYKNDQLLIYRGVATALEYVSIGIYKIIDSSSGNKYYRNFLLQKVGKTIDLHNYLGSSIKDKTLVVTSIYEGVSNRYALLLGGIDVNGNVDVKVVLANMTTGALVRPIHLEHIPVAYPCCIGLPKGFLLIGGLVIQYKTDEAGHPIQEKVKYARSSIFYVPVGETITYLSCGNLATARYKASLCKITENTYAIIGGYIIFNDQDIWTNDIEYITFELDDLGDLVSVKVYRSDSTITSDFYTARHMFLPPYSSILYDHAENTHDLKEMQEWKGTIFLPKGSTIQWDGVEEVQVLNSDTDVQLNTRTLKGTITCEDLERRIA